MIKLFVTGDLHIGKKFDRYPDVKNALIDSRFACLERMILEAENRGCSIFAVTGDTFDNVSTIKVGDVKRVVGILAKFPGTVLVLPGNHDFYSEEAKVWKDFRNAMDQVENNIILLSEFSVREIDAAEETVRIYPAFCQSKHSAENNLGWIREAEIDPDAYNIGMAHGAIRGITPDQNGEYFLMTESELNAVPVDVWLIGHTHIPYPALEAGRTYRGYKIYNAGTPEQLDLHNNTKGYGFVITLEKSDGHTAVTAEAYHSGDVSYQDRELSLDPASKSLTEALQETAEAADARTVLRLSLSGTVTGDEFENRHQLYQQYLSGLMTYEVTDDELNVQITKDRIYAEFPEYGFAASVLEQLMDDPIELQMAYNLLKECRE